MDNVVGFEDAARSTATANAELHQKLLNQIYLVTQNLADNLSDKENLSRTKTIESLKNSRIVFNTLNYFSASFFEKGLMNLNSFNALRQVLQELENEFDLLLISFRLVN